jgi:hypothetical protein
MTSYSHVEQEPSEPQRADTPRRQYPARSREAERYIGADEYDVALLLSQLRHADYPTSTCPESCRAVWLDHSSVSPTPVWYRVAGHEK